VREKEGLEGGYGSSDALLKPSKRTLMDRPEQGIIVMVLCRPRVPWCCVVLCMHICVLASWHV